LIVNLLETKKEGIEMANEKELPIVVVCADCGEMSDSVLCLWCAEEEMLENAS